MGFERDVAEGPDLMELVGSRAESTEQKIEASLVDGGLDINKTEVLQAQKQEQVKPEGHDDDDDDAEAADVCTAMASTGLSVRVHVPRDNPRCTFYPRESKKPMHDQVTRLRMEDQQAMEDVCTDACGSGCMCGGCGGGMTSPCRRRVLHHIHHECFRPTPHCDSPFISDSDESSQRRSSGSGSSSHSHSSAGGCGIASNGSTPRASTPSPLGIRTRSWSTAAADAAWDSAASIARTISSSF
ncbi:hypothetical protein KP509_02G106100 [Ceratopteris richardii]|uniref:Uncharacterized protein n=1 Tax=Ceratopteris richardii TaxID=49495 RepID=A0A8T2VD00_CERRI|nr:hypothetical protein KP509_02G106100 [Ceratopteris richardii]